MCVLSGGSSATWKSAGVQRSLVRQQYEATVRPSSMRYVRPSAKQCRPDVDGTEALDWKVEQVLAAMRDRGLLGEKAEA